MNSLVVFCLAIASVSCSAIYGPAPLPLAAPLAVDGGALLKGPSSATTSVGPDGSSITSFEDSGAVGIAPRAGIAAPAVLPPPPPPAPVVYAAPAVVPPLPPPAPVVYAAPAVVPPPPPAPIAYAAPAVVPPPPAPWAGAVIEGPSGRIAAAGPAAPLLPPPAPWAPAPAVVEARIGW